MTNPLPSLKVVPYFLVFIAVEAVVRVLQGKPLPRLNDSINSMSAGLILSLSKIVTGLIEVREGLRELPCGP